MRYNAFGVNSIVSGLSFDRGLPHALYARHGGDLASLRAFEPQMPTLGYSVHKEARKILYLMVRHFAPEVVVEISPKRGLSTLHIALALEHNGHGRVLSFERNYRSIRRAVAHVRRNGLAHRVEFVYGDARAEVPRRLARFDGLEFLYLDSDHGGEFARWYTRALFPFVRRHGVIHVDDIMTDPHNFARRRELFPLPATGEEEEVVRFLLTATERYTWFSLADCVRQPAYLDAVGPLGGGDVSIDVRSATRDVQRAFCEQVGMEWNPSLWVQKTETQESTEIVHGSFTRCRRDPAARLLAAFRRRRIAALSAPAVAPGDPV